MTSLTADHGGHHPGVKISPGCGLEVFEQGLDRRPAEIPQELAVVLEKDAQHLRDGEDHLAVRDIEQKLLPHPLAPFLKALDMTGGKKSAAAYICHPERT